MGRTAVVAYFIFLYLIPVALAQQVKVSGAFQGDSIKIGEQIPYAITASYPRYLDIIFPDSTFDYSPFEFVDRYYFPTHSDSLISFDSVVYHLTTFEIDSVQYLQIPVYIPQLEEDSLAIYPEPDSLILNHVIRQLPDSVKLKENTAFLDIPSKFNYPVFLVILVTLLVIILVIAIFFGQRVKRWFMVWLMKRKHKKFTERFYDRLGRLRNGQAGIEPEDVLSEWKKYMEKLENEPYTKLTSRELIDLHADQRLKENLRSIDRYIYGNIKDRPLHEHFEKLLEYTVERYELKIEEVRNG